MWKSKRFILLAVLAAAIMVGSIAGVVYAQEDGDEDASKAVLLERVADKLGIEPQLLEDAFNEVIGEMRDEAQLRWLEKAVEEGLITAEEAQEYSEWWAAKPDVDFDAVVSENLNGTALADLECVADADLVSGMDRTPSRITG